MWFRKRLVDPLLAKGEARIDRHVRRLEQHAEFQSRVSAQTQIAQHALWHSYRSPTTQRPKLSEAGFRCFSQFEEDGLLLYIFAALGTFSGEYLDLGCADGINSNCANLALNFGWRGTMVDGSVEKIRTGQDAYSKAPIAWAYPPKFVCDLITAENVNDIVRRSNVSGEIDFLSIDIDGNDYWVWQALEATNPKVVMIETHTEFGLNDIVVPYDATYSYPGRHPDYHGASPTAMAKLAERKGYRLVGANAYGFNTIYVREGLAEDILPKVSVESILWHPRNVERAKLFEPIKDWPYVSPT